MAYEALYEARVAKHNIEEQLAKALQEFSESTGLLVESVDLNVIDIATVGSEHNKLYGVDLVIRVLPDMSY